MSKSVGADQMIMTMQGSNHFDGKGQPIQDSRAAESYPWTYKKPRVHHLAASTDWSSPTNQPDKILSFKYGNISIAAFHLGPFQYFSF